MEHAPAALESGFLTTEPLSSYTLNSVSLWVFPEVQSAPGSMCPRAVAPSRGPSVSFLCLRRPAHPSRGQLSSQPRPRPAPREGGGRRCGGAGGSRSTRVPRPSLVAVGGGRGQASAPWRKTPDLKEDACRQRAWPKAPTAPAGSQSRGGSASA